MEWLSSIRSKELAMTQAEFLFPADVEVLVFQPFKLVGEVFQVDMCSCADISPLKVTCGFR